MYVCVHMYANIHMHTQILLSFEITLPSPNSSKPFGSVICFFKRFGIPNDSTEIYALILPIVSSQIFTQMKSLT